MEGKNLLILGSLAVLVSIGFLLLFNLLGLLLKAFQLALTVLGITSSVLFLQFFLKRLSEGEKPKEALLGALEDITEMISKILKNLKGKG
jgi:hypothetical protein